MLILEEQEGYTLIIVLWSIIILTIIFLYLLDDVLINNYLIEGYSQQIKLRQVALSAYNIGLNMLLNDETLYDSEKDLFFQPVQGKINGTEYSIYITDTGSRVNVNYDDISILKKADGWDDKLEIYLESNLVPDLLFLKNILSEDDYQLFKEFTTTYGHFNVNQDSPEKIEKLFNYLELSYSYSDTLCESLKEFQGQEEFTSIDEILYNIDGLDMVAFNKIKEYLAIEGRININFVGPDILKAIIKAKELDSKVVEEILLYRKKNEIKKIEDLSDILSFEEYEKIKDLFTTSSKYLELGINVLIPEKRSYEIKVILERRYQEEQWMINILSWTERDIDME